MRILVVSPHPDDETLGAGGTLLKYKKEGGQLFWLNITAMSPELGYTEQAIERKEKQIARVREAYGFEEFADLRYSTTKLDTYDAGKAISTIGAVFDRIRPEIVILPDPRDAHTDHEAVFRWCYSCTKKFRHSYIKRVMTMEIPSETDFGSPFDHFNPNYYVDITDYFGEKSNILEIYDTELGEHPFPRNLRRLEALAIVRGGEANCEYAEAFHILKMYE